MPELPEVEALVDFLRERTVGRRIQRIDVAAVSVLKTYDPPVSTLHGRSVTAADRHGKFLDLDAEGLHLVFHLGRAGWLRWSEALSPIPPKPGRGPIALRLHLETGAGFDLTEAGTQKRLAAYVVGAPDQVPGVARLGVDPLGPAFTVEALAGLLVGDRGQLKGVLKDQSKIAGIGNAYSDEVLHAARLSPFRPARNLRPEEVVDLHASIRTLLGEAIGRARGVAAAGLKAEKRSGMRVHGRTGEACPECGDTIREVSFADSSLQYCPACQTGGAVLADRRLSRLLK
ncbi:MAG TPA: DNA-formamidopyrimidine glycosylase family protein [Mycobacteriales bacterium]|nr:DNA-formamidopyrimidine glycosylase family protein [Mycobacteriales bacterium]